MLRNFRDKPVIVCSRNRKGPRDCSQIRGGGSSNLGTSRFVTIVKRGGEIHPGKVRSPGLAVPVAGIWGCQSRSTRLEAGQGLRGRCGRSSRPPAPAVTGAGGQSGV